MTIHSDFKRTLTPAISLKGEEEDFMAMRTALEFQLSDDIAVMVHHRYGRLKAGLFFDVLLGVEFALCFSYTVIKIFRDF